MQVLVMGRDYAAQAQTAVALVERGFQVICAETPDAAEAFLSMQVIDVMILSEGNSGSLAQAVGMVTGWCDPHVSVILMTDRTGGAIDDLYSLIPSLYSVVGLRTAPAMLARLAMAALSIPQEVVMRGAPVAEPAGPALPDPAPIAAAEAAEPEPAAEPVVELAAEPAVAAVAGDKDPSRAEWEALLRDIRAQRRTAEPDTSRPTVTGAVFDEALPDWARPRAPLIRTPPSDRATATAQRQPSFAG